MNNAIRDMKLIDMYAGEMDGVFSSGDLQRLFGQDNPVLLYRRIRMLEEANVLTRFSRGFYITPGFNREVLCARINPNSYISLGSALAKDLMIGSIPATSVYAIKTGKNREYSDKGLTLIYMGISSALFFGYRLEKGIRIATAEKALLDTLFFHQRGYSFSFNIYEDINIGRIDQNLLFQWLRIYRNPRFITFVKGFIYDRS